MIRLCVRLTVALLAYLLLLYVTIMDQNEQKFGHIRGLISPFFFSLHGTNVEVERCEARVFEFGM